jgi:hypothetical protein
LSVSCPVVAVDHLNLLIPASEAKPVFEVPTVREYFMDLDYVLGIISDGPAKSFAYRRLKYLLSKWSIYSLVNEYQEMADMKVSQFPVPMTKTL